MPRYIDADKIKQELLAKDAEIGKPKDLKKALKSAGIFLALVHIQLAEAEDVAPVIHAHWVESYENIKCSECSAEYSDEIVFMNRDFKAEALKYCPNCGSKMDEEVENG